MVAEARDGLLDKVVLQRVSQKSLQALLSNRTDFIVQSSGKVVVAKQIVVKGGRELRTCNRTYYV